MNEFEKPEKCNIKYCNNKAYAKNNLTPTMWEWVCRRHYKEYVYGVTK